MSLATSDIIDRSPSTIARALREMVKGDVYDDPITRTLYSTDGSIYEIEPLVVVHPLDELDVRSCMWFGQKHGFAVIARGAGSGVAGESLGKGIIVDMSVYMKGIVELDKRRMQVTVQAGVVLDSLNRALRPHGFRVGPDPLNSNRCTVGGMIARNAAGPHALHYGDMRKNLVAARVCVMDGMATLANPVKLSSSDFEEKKKEEGLSGKIHRELPELIKKNAALIAAKKPKVERNRAGYQLDDVISNEIYDLSRVLCGSEGTLGIVTQAVLKVHTLPERVGMLEILFGSLLDAAKAVETVRAANPFACELLDRTMLDLRRNNPRFAGKLPAPQDAQAALIVEFEGQAEEDVAERIAQLEANVKALPHVSFRRIMEPEQEALVWAARISGTPAIYARTDNLQPVSIVEDAVVPVGKLATYIEKAGKIFEKYKLQWSACAHAGQGEVHLMPLLDLRTKEHLDILEKVAGEVHAIVWECGGTISGTHGEGLARSQWLEKQAGKELYAVFTEVKSIFDPSGLLNPNKKITTDAHLMLKQLRFGAHYQFSTGERPKPSSIDPTQAANFRMFKSQTAVRTEGTVEQFAHNPMEVHTHGKSPLNWGGSELAAEAERCNGCGYCRTTGPEEDMCPRFKYERIEDASPRAKANVIRRMMTGRQTAGAFSSEELSELMDTCYNCKLCHDGCPSHVNIPKLVLEAKARYHQAHGLPLSTQMFANAESIMRPATYVSPLYNTLINNGIARFVLEKLTGVDRTFKLPYLRRWRPMRRYTPSPGSDRAQVVLYLDLLAKYNSPEIAQAAVDVLEHHGFEVEIPDAPWCNSPALSEGAVEIARKQVNAVAAVLAPYAFRGVPIITVNASAAMALQEDFLTYVDTPQSRAVARHTYEIGQFLMNLKSERKLKTKFNAVELVCGYHQSCHQKALHVGTPGLELLRLIPGVKAIQLNHGCCGNPWMWGAVKKNRDESLWIGRKLFEQIGDARLGIEVGVSESACCKLQIENAGKKPVLHPIQVLAKAYGYSAPEVHDDNDDEAPAPAPVHDDHHAVTVVAPTPSMSAASHAHSH
jgi:FAD/FMN-containing dehydrogenase/Fe-S oxidoreductase